MGLSSKLEGEPFYQTTHEPISWLLDGLERRCRRCELNRTSPQSDHTTFCLVLRVYDSFFLDSLFYSWQACWLGDSHLAHVVGVTNPMVAGKIFWIFVLHSEPKNVSRRHLLKPDCPATFAVCRMKVFNFFLIINRPTILRATNKLGVLCFAR